MPVTLSRGTTRVRQFDLSPGEETSIGRRDVVYKAKIHRKDLRVSRKAAILSRNGDTVVLSVPSGSAPITISHNGDVISVGPNEQSAIDCNSKISMRGSSEFIAIDYSFGDATSMFAADTETEEEEVDLKAEELLPPPPDADETQPDADATQRDADATQPVM